MKHELTMHIGVDASFTLPLPSEWISSRKAILEYDIAFTSSKEYC
jgi:hypothetical protein